MMNSNLAIKPVDAKIVVAYSDDQLDTMREIGEKVCFATKGSLEQRIYDIPEIKVKTIRHAKKLNGSIDLVFEISMGTSKLDILYEKLEKLKKEVGLKKASLYADVPITAT